MKLHHLFESRNTLYVSRKLLNGNDLHDWAKEQGIPQILNEDDLHVTIMYCKKRIEWDNGVLDKRKLTIIHGHREMDIFGEDALVLKFASRKLQARFKEFQDIGAESDYPKYQPHITISYDAKEINFENIAPYRGELRFGPEVWKGVNKNWSDGVEEIKLT
jgi:hypothetical protein